jgi:hypothetical protein
MCIMRKPMYFLLALIFLAEEWIWDRVSAFGAWAGTLPVIRQLESAIKRLPPYGALSLLIVPAALLLPFKLLALWAIAHGHAALGFAVIIAAKLTGTAFVARLYALCSPQLKRIRWAAWVIMNVTMFRNRVHAWLESQPAWHAARAAIRDLKVRFSRRSVWRRWCALRLRRSHRD